MNDFLYPINDRDPDRWGDEPVLDYFGGLRSGARANWYLGNSYRAIEAGDRIWVYAAAPHSRIVAVGLADDYPKWNVDIEWWRVPIRWDVPVTKVLVRASPPPLQAYPPMAPRRIDADDLVRLLDWHRDVGAPVLQGLPDEVQQRYAQVRVRQGQQDFRAKLIEAYGGRCAVTECDVEAALQAAHVEGYSGRNSNVTNGLLLRADVHNLFDKGLIWIDGNYHVRVSPTLPSRHYRNFDGRELRRPTRREDWPDKEKLRAHREGVGQ